MWGYSASPADAGPASPANPSSVDATGCAGAGAGDNRFSNSNRPSAEDISLRMQHMIDLQYETIGLGSRCNQTIRTPDYAPPMTDSPVLKLLPKAKEKPATRSILPSIRNYQSVPSDPEMGRGQLFFPSDYPRPAMENEFNQQLQSPTNDHRMHPYEHHHLEDNHHDKPFSPRTLPYSGSCCCLWPSIARFIYYIYDAENLHRSCCCSAIDGLLTGAGIISTFYGMHLLEPTSPIQIQCIAIMVSLCACTADALCMAMGHIWSTHVLSMQLAGDLREQRTAFDTDRSNVKGKLVDILLTRGMLKIDAMSIVDTLEGYPDIFISALVGEGSSIFATGQDETDAMANTRNNGWNGNGDAGDTSYGAMGQYRSYGQFNELEHDPEAAAVAASTHECQKEGTVMFLAFATFAAVPGTVFLLVGLMMGDTTNAVVSVTSMTIFLTSVIMLLLGIWKSKLYDSNWVMFGVETVVVLLICIMSAYFLGVALSSLLPDQAMLAFKGASGYTTTMGPA